MGTPSAPQVAVRVTGTRGRGQAGLVEAMADASPPPETVTVLFTDLVDSTALTSRLGPVRGDALLRDHRDALTEVVEEAGGRVVKSLGDGVMAAFGSASAAIECGVAMQQRETGTGRHGVDRLAVRIGIASGDVVADRGDYSGAPVVQAARLCDAARGGQILATELVGLMAASRTNARLSRVGELELKGLPEPVPAVEVAWAPDPRAGARSGTQDALLEREQVADELAALVEAAAGGRGGLVVLDGPAGIGKTRCVGLAAELAGAAGLAVLQARGAELEVDYGWGIVRQVFERWLAERTDTEREAALRGPAAAAAPALGQAVAGEDADPFSTIHGLYWLAVNAAELSPLALLVDDAQWADEASLRWLAYVAARLSELPLALVLAIRRPDPSADRDLLVRIAAEPASRAHRLAPMSADAIRALLLARAGLGDNPELVSACADATGGNPFLLRALLDDLAEVATGAPPDPAAVRLLQPEAVSRSVLLRLGRRPRTRGRWPAAWPCSAARPRSGARPHSPASTPSGPPPPPPGSLRPGSPRTASRPRSRTRSCTARSSATSPRSSGPPGTRGPR